MDRNKGVIIGIYLLGFATLFWLWHTDRLEAVEVFLERGGPRVYVAYVLLYVVLSLFFIPVNWLNILAGAVFGPFMGAFFILLSVAVASTVAFFIGRHFLDPDWVLEKIPGKAAFLKKMINEKNAWKTVLVLRVSNVAPFSVINYLASAMEIRYWGYLTATLIGGIPGTLIYSGLGALLVAFFRG